MTKGGEKSWQRGKVVRKFRIRPPTKEKVATFCGHHLPIKTGKSITPAIMEKEPFASLYSKRWKDSA